VNQILSFAVTATIFGLLLSAFMAPTLYQYFHVPLALTLIFCIMIAGAGHLLFSQIMARRMKSADSNGVTAE
jgi:hypothetical protein